MDIYRNALCVLNSLLDRGRVSRWAEYIAHDIEAWENSRSKEHHRAAYGGMGSINDVVFSVSTLADIWANNLFASVKSVSFALSHRGNADIHKLFSNPNGTLTGSICGKCRYAEVSAFELEDAVSFHFTPRLLNECLPDDKLFLNLTDVAALSGDAEVTAMRNEFMSGISDAGITYNAGRKTRMKPCPNCNAEDTWVYRWDVVAGDGVLLTPAQDNLQI